MWIVEQLSLVPSWAIGAIVGMIVSAPICGVSFEAGRSKGVEEAADWELEKELVQRKYKARIALLVEEEVRNLGEKPNVSLVQEETDAGDLGSASREYTNIPHPPYRPR